MARFRNLKRIWNVFRYEGVANQSTRWEVSSTGSTSVLGPSSSTSPSRILYRYGNERSIVTSIYLKLALDVSGLVFRHVKVDDDERYIEDVESFLSDCLLFEPNLDQGPRHFRMDIASALFDQGVAAIVPVEIDPAPDEDVKWDIKQLRVGTITEWFPSKVRIDVYNQDTGKREEIIVDKKIVAIVENPFYAIMNEPNSTLQRLLRKMALLDSVDEKISAGKLDIIIQLPYIVKTESKKAQAENRRQQIEDQIINSPLGIAYIEGTEKITQLNRPVENNLLKQVEVLLEMLHTQLGLTAEILNGTADESAMTNYYARTIEPVGDVIVEAMQRAFITPAARMDKERIIYTRDPFKLVPLTQIAEVIDKLGRNEVMTSNESRNLIGRKPVKDPKADKLINSNMPQPVPNQIEGQQQKQLEPAMVNPQEEQSK